MRIVRNAAMLAAFVLCSTQLPAQALFQAAGPAVQTRQVEFAILMPLQNRDQLDQTLVQMNSEGSPTYRKWMSAGQFKQEFGPKPSDIAAIQTELAKYNIHVVSTNAHGLRVAGAVADIQRAFHTRLANGVAAHGRTKLVATSPLTLPASLKNANAVVVAFAPVVRMHTHSMQTGAPVPANRYSQVGLYWFDDLKQAYNFPSYKIFNGTGRTIGILMTNDFSDADMAAYFGNEGLPVPKIIREPVDGGAPFDPTGGSLEISLDIQQAGGMAPNATIVHYNIPDLSDQSLFDGLIQILEDNSVDIVNMSFGGAEGLYTAAYNSGVDFTSTLHLFDDIFKEGNALGITFVASSGDSGALGLPPVNYFNPPTNPPTVVGDFQVGVEFPAISPHVTAVGGTNLVTRHVAGSLASGYVRENADGDPEIPYDPYGTGNLISGGIWGAGGGVSTIFTKPHYQNLVNTGTNMRAIPDVSMHMGGCVTIAIQPCGPDRSADLVVFGGNVYGVIGTSASSPDFAGVLALTEERLGGYRLGNANNLIYSLAAAQNFGIITPFHQGIPGYNGYYTAQAGVSGYNFVIGNGTTSVRDFMLAPDVHKAGKPQTPSNP